MIERSKFLMGMRTIKNMTFKVRNAVEKNHFLLALCLKF
jgi:hypothetical protein